MINPIYGKEVASDSDNYIQNTEIVVITDAEELYSYKEEWDAFSNHVYSSWVYYYNRIKHNDYIEQPYVIIIKTDEKIQSIIAGYITTERTSLFKLGYSSLFSIKVRKIIIPIGCVMGDFAEIDLNRLLLVFKNSIKQLKADCLYFNYLNTDNEIYKYFLPRFKYLKNNLTPVKHYSADLEKDRDLFIRKLNKYKKRSKTPDKFDFNSVEIDCFSSEEQIKDFIDHANTISQKSFKRNIGHSFIFPKEKEVLYKTAAKAHNLFCYTLKIDNKYCAFLSVIIHDGICYFDQSGYDHEYKYSSPGSYILIKALYDVLESNKVNKIDFGPEEISFKKRLSKDYDEVAHLVLHSTKLRSTLMRFASNISFHIKKNQKTSIHEKMKEVHKQKIIKKLKST